LVFVVLSVGVLILVLGMMNGQEFRRTWSCKQRLKELGGAFQQYVKDNDNALPPAALLDGEKQIAWDQLIAPYLVAMPKNTTGTNALSTGLEKAAEYFACPSDREPRGGARTRSYSMPMYDVKKQGWPADSESVGGLGLYLDQAQLKAERAARPGEGNKFVPVIKVAMASAPADTALLVERIAIRNGLWGTTFACTVALREQWDAKTLERRKFHGGKFNYLMLDGHVELMWPAQSSGLAGSGGLWTINAKD
jgi:prepilin-type processing-associated H-X9-DG protein